MTIYSIILGEIHSRLSREYKSLILASINCSNGFSYDKRQTSSEDTQEHTVKDNICKGNVLDPNQCCKAAELDGNLNNVSLQKESDSNTSYSRYICTDNYISNYCGYFKCTHLSRQVKIMIFIS